MSEIIKWSELTHGQRNRLIGEKVMGDTYTCNVIPDFTTHQNPSRAGGIAFTYTTWLCPACGATGYYGKEALVAHEKPTPIPSYSTSLDIAWFVLQEMVRLRKTDERVFELFSSHLFDLAASQLSEADYGGAWGDYILAAQWTPERICVAALRAVGVEVQL